MDSFRTVLPPRNWDFKIDYPSKHFLIGSCFSEHIGTRLERAKFSTCLNPFGILFHPLAIQRSLQRLLDKKCYSEQDLRLEDGRYISFDHHGVFNHADQKTALSTINESFQQAHSALKSADFLYITFGSSTGYVHNDECQKIVSNCHKIPSFHFTKVYSTSDEIVAAYKVLINKLLQFNSKLKIIFSVSPVKHLKDGIIENNRSKARLLEAVHQIEEAYSNVYYFPSFELLQDDLRDYRFYAKDMAHPNDQAIDYIWEYFQNNLWKQEAIDLYKKILNLQKSFNHRILHPETDQYKSFVEHTLKKARELENEFPFISFDQEKKKIINASTAN